MAKIRDLLMGIAFFGKGYINAKKRNDQEAATKMYQALQMQQLELQLEKAKAEEKRRVAEEKRLAKKREREQAKQTATEQIALSNGDPKDILRTRSAIDQGRYYTTPSGEVRSLERGGLGPTYGGVRTARDPGKTFLEEAQPGKARLDVTDLSLRGKPTLPSAMQRLQAGKSIIPTTAERAFPGGTYQPPAMTSAMRGEFPALADRPALAERLTEPRMERPQLAETIREDLVAPVTTKPGDLITGTTKANNEGDININEMLKRDFLQAIVGDIPISGTSADIQKQIMVEKYNADRRVRARERKTQEKLENIPSPHYTAAALIINKGMGVSSPKPRLIFEVTDKLKKDGFTEGVSVDDQNIVKDMIQFYRDSQITSEEKEERDAAKIVRDAKTDQLELEKKTQDTVNALPKAVSETARLILLQHRMDQDNQNLILVSNMLKENGFGTGDKNKDAKTISLVSNALVAIKANTDTPTILIPDPDINSITDWALFKHTDKETKPAIKSNILYAYNNDKKRNDGVLTDTKDAIHVAIALEEGESLREKIRMRQNGMVDLDRAKKKYREYLKKGGTVGLIQKWLTGKKRQIGAPFSLERDLTDMLITIDNMFFQFRNTMTGSVFSEGETAQYQNLFPDIKDTPQTFFDKVDAFTNVHNRHNHNFYTSRIPKGLYERVFGGSLQQEKRHPFDQAYIIATDNGTKAFNINAILKDSTLKQLAPLFLPDPNEAVEPLSDEDLQELKTLRQKHIDANKEYIELPPSMINLGGKDMITKIRNPYYNPPTRKDKIISLDKAEQIIRKAKERISGK